MDSNNQTGGSGVLLLGSDLLFGSKIREEISRLGKVARPARTLDQVRDLLGKGDVGAAVVDLNFQGADPFAAISIVKELAAPLKLVAYCSHVDKDLMTRAEEAGVETVLPRSALIKQLGTLLA